MIDRKSFGQLHQEMVGMLVEVPRKLSHLTMPRVSRSTPKTKYIDFIKEQLTEIAETKTLDDEERELATQVFLMNMYCHIKKNEDLFKSNLRRILERMLNSDQLLGIKSKYGIEFPLKHASDAFFYESVHKLTQNINQHREVALNHPVLFRQAIKLAMLVGRAEFITHKKIPFQLGFIFDLFTEAEKTRPEQQTMLLLKFQKELAEKFQAVESLILQHRLPHLFIKLMRRCWDELDQIIGQELTREQPKKRNSQIKIEMNNSSHTIIQETSPENNNTDRQLLIQPPNNITIEIPEIVPENKNQQIIPNLRHITTNELFDFIKRHIDAGTFTGLNWSQALQSEGYHAEFNNINFEKIIIGLTFYKCLDAWNKSKISGITFNQCEAIPFSNICYIDCRFNQCNLEKDITTTNLQFCKFEDVTFKNITIKDNMLQDLVFNNCNFLNTSILSQPTQNIIITHSVIKNCKLEIPLKDTYEKNEIDLKTTVTGTGIAWETKHDDRLSKLPLVVMLYCKEHGFDYGKMLQDYYEQHGVLIKLVSPDVGMKDAIFSTPEKISGIILPGGENIPNLPKEGLASIPKEGLSDKDLINLNRYNFEEALIELSLNNIIPMLGVCRGHQVIGRHFNIEVNNVKVKQSTDKPVVSRKHIVSHPECKIIAPYNVQYVKNKKGSIIYNLLEQKYQEFKANPEKQGRTFLHKEEYRKKKTGGPNDRFAYYSACAHKQRLFVKKGRSEQEKRDVMITAKASDGTPEALQIRKPGTDHYHILSFQNHNEDLFTDIAKDLNDNINGTGTEVAESLLNLHLGMVKNYFEKPKEIHQNNRVNLL